MKTISVLGSTGSIGTNTLRVTSSFPKDFRVVGLTGGKNVTLLAQQIEEVRPEIASSGDEHASAELQSLLRQRGYPMARTRFVSRD